MDLRTGIDSRPEGTAGLPTVTDADADALTAPLEDSGDVEDVREDLTLLRNATLMTARQRLDWLLLQLTVHPFDAAAYRGRCSYLVGPGVLALAAYERVSASTARGI